MKVIGTDGKEYTIKPEADLEGADLNRANLSNADLREANLSGAVWNGETVFPKGFEIPERVGLRLLRRRL